jgi:hypothetical protein
VNTEPGIWSAHARDNDRKAVDRLLTILPDDIRANARELVRSTGRGKHGMRYDAATRKAFWLQHGSDGVLSCFTFEDVATIEKAAEMGLGFEQAAPLNFQVMSAIYVVVTGCAAEVIGTRQ